MIFFFPSIHTHAHARTHTILCRSDRQLQVCLATHLTVISMAHTNISILITVWYIG